LLKIAEVGKNIKNKTFAMLLAPLAIPVKPNSAAIKEIIKNIKDQISIFIYITKLGVFIKLCQI
jgi:hypothetical protein